MNKLAKKHLQLIVRACKKTSALPVGLPDVGGKVIWVTNGRDHSPTAVRKIKAGSQGAGTPSQAVIDYLAVPTRPDGPQSDRPTDGNARGTGTDLSFC